MKTLGVICSTHFSVLYSSPILFVQFDGRQTEEAALNALLKSNDCNLEDTAPALEQLMTLGNECGELTTWTFSQVYLSETANFFQMRCTPSATSQNAMFFFMLPRNLFLG